MTLVPLLLQAIPGAYSSLQEVFVQLRPTKKKKNGVGVRMDSKSGLVIVWVNVKTKKNSEIEIFFMQICKPCNSATAGPEKE